MHRPAVTSSPASQTFFQNDAPGTPVDVILLGVRVTAYAVINVAEHSRREAAGLGAVINPALLDRLLDLPVDMSVNDPVMWTEMADQPPGILERSQDGTRITRRLESPLAITGVVVKAAPGTRVLLPAEKPVTLTVDGWSWLLKEKTYRSWLSRRPDNDATESPAPA